MDRELVAALAREAAALNERRVLVLHGERGHAQAAAAAIDAAAEAVEDVTMAETTLVGPDGVLPCEHLEPHESGRLLGTTRSAIVLDCREACRPTALGQVVGAVDGGGLLVLLTPPLTDWADRRDGFDETLAVPPDGIDAVIGHFRSRLVETLKAHPGIAIYDLDTATAQRAGLTGREPPRPAGPIERAGDTTGVPDAVFAACLTQGQADAVGDLAALQEGPRAAVLEADRGRGKSSVAGLLAAWFVARGEQVTVTGPDRRAATAFFDRVEELLPALDGVRDRDGTPQWIEAESGGRVTYVDPVDLDGILPETDVLFVEEAAALPVRLLERTLDVDSVAYVTTVHGYEGSGRGFAVRFRDRLEAARHDILEVSLAEPIRYAGGDPVEAWAARALLLGAGPVPGQVIDDAIPDSVTYRELTGGELRADEQLLREVFGLLVTAHYRTEPDDLARLLDGSNLAVRALFEEGHVVAVALLGREGGLPAATRGAVARGERIRGNMLPDVLMSQLRDEAAGRPVGLRVVRIATHDAVRSRGLGSALLDAVETEFSPVVDWLGTGFGATPELVDFWAANGYAPVHLSTGRNDRSGEHSVLMVKPTSPAGLELAASHGQWFASRIGGQLLDALDGLDPRVLRGVLAAVPGAPRPSLSAHQWRVVASAAYGPGLYSVDPRPFRDLVLYALIDGASSIENPDLLVRGLLQHQPWEVVAAEMGYVSRAAALRALGETLQPIVDTYGPPAAEAVRRRFAPEN